MFEKIRISPFIDWVLFIISSENISLMKVETSQLHMKGCKI